MNLTFLGIGAQKSATSWLFQCLREHPELSLAPAKEIHFFSNDTLFQKGSEWYQAQFPKGDGEKPCGEISTSYLSFPEAPERIHAFAPKVKLIALLRHPVDRAESHIRHLVSTGDLPLGVRLSEAIKLRTDILENGRYATHLARYRKWFPEEQIFIGTYDEVKKNPMEILSRIQKFLGVSPHIPQALHMKYNASSFRASPLHHYIHSCYFFLQKSLLGQFFLTLLKRGGLKPTRVADTVAKLGEGKERELFTLSKDERMSLSSIFREEIHSLEGEGIHFSSL